MGTVACATSDNITHEQPHSMNTPRALVALDACPTRASHSCPVWLKMCRLRTVPARTLLTAVSPPQHGRCRRHSTPPPRGCCAQSTAQERKSFQQHVWTSACRSMATHQQRAHMLAAPRVVASTLPHGIQHTARPGRGKHCSGSSSPPSNCDTTIEQCTTRTNRVLGRPLPGRACHSHVVATAECQGSRHWNCYGCDNLPRTMATPNHARIPLHIPPVLREAYIHFEMDDELPEALECHLETTPFGSTPRTRPCPSQGRQHTQPSVFVLLTLALAAPLQPTDTMPHLVYLATQYHRCWY